MARPILVVKNIDGASKNYTQFAKHGRKTVRANLGIPFALQDIIAAKPRAKSAILGVLKNGDRFNGQKLVRLLARTPNLTAKEIVTGVEKAII